MKLTGKVFWGSVFPVHKPSGLTSSDVVRRIKLILSNHVRNTNQSKLVPRVGHGGTLDKGACGVLVIGVGDGCKELTQYLQCDKVYLATGILGTLTDTLDDSGNVIKQKSFSHVSENHLIATLKSFKGQQLQIPPLYSAVKVDGRRASDWARKGITVDLRSKEKTIVVYSIALKCFELPFFEFVVSCSSGTYIRCLVRDIGERLGTVACMKHLCRLKQGRYGLNEALNMEKWTFQNITDACA